MKKLAIALGIFYLGAATLFLCLPRAKPRPKDTLATLAPELSVSFPPSTQLVGVQRYNGMDDLIAVKVTMARTEWPQFLASTALTESQLISGEVGLLGPDEGFWDPNRHADLRTGQTAPAGDPTRALNIGVAAESTERVAVYVVNHGT